MIKFHPDRPLIIAGPCLAESYEIMLAVGTALKEMSLKFNFDYVFKASFDKANRSSMTSYRGPGFEKVMQWFVDLKKELGCPVLTDVHEVIQVENVASVVDGLQIPAFLCRQTDLLVAAVKTGSFVNVKKGQFVPPKAMVHIVNKAKMAQVELGQKTTNIALTERGTCFGYGDLVVDMRAFSMMKESGVPLLFDITHSTQRPALGDGSVSSYTREFAPVLARAATATGNLSGYFIEVHPKPADAKSDAGAQLAIPQAEKLIAQLVPLWLQMKECRNIDKFFGE